MENLFLKETKTTPEVNFNGDTGVLKIAGESYPENALEFYKPIFKWLKKFLADEKRKVQFNFKMIYFNTSSSKAILDILDMLEEFHQKGGKATVYWHYQENDEDIQESGEEFAEGLTIPYKLVAYK